MRGQRVFLPVVLLLALYIAGSQQFAYLFNYGNTVNGPKVVTHTSHYTGTGGNISISVGINPNSTNLAAFRIAILNNILTWNLQIPTSYNVKALASTNLYDLESVTLHEMGHSLGLAHDNLASESALAFPLADSTAAYWGANGAYDVNAGADGYYGSADDIRGDDLNLNYFNAQNDPFVLVLPADSTNYQSNMTKLVAGANFVTIGGIYESISLVSKRGVDQNDELNRINELAPIIHNHNHNHNHNREFIEQQDLSQTGEHMQHQHVCEATLRIRPQKEKSKRVRPGNTETVMHQGAYSGEYKRTLSSDDIAALSFARAGLDGIAGTADDYNFQLHYVGESTGNDITVYFNPSYTGVGATYAGGNVLPNFHYYVQPQCTININPNEPWYFNPYLTTILNFPSSQSQTILTTGTMAIDLFFASAGPSAVTASTLTLTSSIGGSLSLTEIAQNHYSVQISGFTGAGTPCLQFTSTSLTDTAYAAQFAESNSLCFSVTSGQVTNDQPAASPSNSQTPTKSPTGSPSKSASKSLSNTPSRTPAASTTSTASQTPAVSPSSAPSQTSAPSTTNTPSHTPAASSTSSASLSSTPSHTPAASSTSTASHTPAVSPSSAPSQTSAPSTTNTPSHTPAASSTSSASLTPSASATPSISHSPAPSSTNTPSHTPAASSSNAPSHTPAASTTSTASHTPAVTPSNTPSHSKAASTTNTASHTPSNTPSHSKAASTTPSHTKAASTTPSHTKVSSSSTASKSVSPSISHSAAASTTPIAENEAKVASSSSTPSKSQTIASHTPLNTPSHSKAASTTPSHTKVSSSNTASKSKAASATPSKSHAAKAKRDVEYRSNALFEDSNDDVNSGSVISRFLYLLPVLVVLLF